MTLISLVLISTVFASDAPTEKDVNHRIKEVNRVEGEEMEASRRIQREPMQVEAAINEPDSTSPTIPINRDLAVPFTKRPDSPEQAEFRLRVVNAIWKTPLGQTLISYLFDKIDPIELPSRSRQFMRLIFADGAQVTTRMAALQLLIEDLYVREKLDNDALRRMFILQSDVFQEGLNAQSKTKNAIVILAGLFFLLSLPFGSPILRQEVTKIYQRPRAFFRRVVRRIKEKPKLEHIALGRLFHRDFFNDYAITAAVNIYFATFGPISMLFFMYKEWSDGATGQLVHDKIMLLGLDSLIRATEF